MNETWTRTLSHRPARLFLTLPETWAKLQAIDLYEYIKSICNLTNSSSGARRQRENQLTTVHKSSSSSTLSRHFEELFYPPPGDGAAGEQGKRAVRGLRHWGKMAHLCRP
ncbi:MAG: hypothetical protein ACM3X0_04970 [Bacteroidota bacterium]